MPTTRWCRDPRLTAGAAIVAVVLAACRGDVDVPERTTDRAAPPVAPSPTADPETGAGGGGSEDGGTGGPAAPAGPLFPVLRVVDGDTIHVLRGGRDLTVRLIGVDTPEVDWYGGDAECYRATAGRFLMRLLEGGRVRLEYDLERIDPYGRTLAYVYLPDGRMVNQLLVRRGYGTVSIYPPNDRHAARLRAAEHAARSDGAGLWSACPVSRRRGGGR